MDHAHAVDELMAITASLRRYEDPPVGKRDMSAAAPENAPPADTVVRPLAPLGGLKPAPGRDYSSALDLIQEATEAMRIAESRSEEMELQLQEIASQAADVVKHLKSEIAARDDRLARSDMLLKAAESRADEAEAMLVRFHDAIHAMVGPALKGKAKPPAAPPPLRVI